MPVLHGEMELLAKMCVRGGGKAVACGLIWSNDAHPNRPRTPISCLARHAPFCRGPRYPNVHPGNEDPEPVPLTRGQLAPPGLGPELLPNSPRAREGVARGLHPSSCHPRVQRQGGARRPPDLLHPRKEPLPFFQKAEATGAWARASGFCAPANRSGPGPAPALCFEWVRAGNPGAMTPLSP
jgi:hypothetical protein